MTKLLCYNTLPNPSLCSPYKGFDWETVSISRVLLGLKEIEWISSLPFTNKFMKGRKKRCCNAMEDFCLAHHACGGCIQFQATSIT